MTRRSRFVATAVLAAAVALVSQCNYAPQNVFRSDIKTVYVQFFDNSTFRRGIEVDLTRAVVNEIKLRTPFVLAPRDRADTVLTGEIVDFDEQAVVKSEENQILLSRARVRVKFRWRDRLTGTDIVPERTVQETVRVGAGTSEAGGAVLLPARVQRATPDSTAFARLFEKVAQDIVDSMEQSW